jgi:tungstate transport system ATP-binding protein
MESPLLPLAFDDVSFAVGGTRLIHDLSFILAAGPRTVILGPNGAGKSLTLRLCHGLLRPTSGAVRWAGPGAQDTPRRQAMVFQNPVMLRRSALANVVYALALNGVPRAQRVGRAEQALARVGLDVIARRPARSLSTGEQQRLALARAWALEPEVLFLDEPTASLDPAATRAIEQAIHGVHQSGAKVVMTTHDLGQAHRLADEVLFLHHGRLVESGPAADFFAAPRSREAAAFLNGELLW